MLVVEDEVAKHVEGGFRLVSGDHVPSVVHKDEPQIVVHLRPSRNCPVDRPDLLWRPLPVADSDPIETIDVVEHTGSVDNEVVLSVVDQDSGSCLEEGNDISCVASGDICSEGIVDVIVSGDIIDFIGDSEASAAVVEESSKGTVTLAILSKVICAHSPPVLVPCIFVVGQKVEELSSLSQSILTFLLSPKVMWWIAWVWNHVQVSLNWLDTMPTL